ncbi:hypothetical protein [Thalassotalea piscium]|uniref:Uncharacterized protein n=1 Tax=Thalassotalea piscium TaxID=1230533 RepID=A0A7X0TTI5_9GAMM|nr:hypothetical protein [Thalassotalea piscium]MBB6543120.1 hypothetical protein [Thalassotalea piscium]
MQVIKDLVKDNSVLKSMYKINELNKDLLPNALIEVSVCLNDKRHAQENGIIEVKPFFFTALQGELIRRIKQLDIKCSEEAQVATIYTLFSVEKYEEICLSPNFKVVLDISENHRYWVNYATSSIVQYYKHSVVSMQYDSHYNFCTKAAELIVIRARLANAKSKSVI